MFILPAFSFDNFFDVKQEIKTALALDVFTQPCQPMSLTQGSQVVLHMKLLHCFTHLPKFFTGYVHVVLPPNNFVMSWAWALAYN